MVTDLVLLAVSFLVLWVGAGLSVSSVEKVSKYIKIPSFLAPFFVLGLLTSMSEISVAYFSVVEKTPGISVGNLVGASTVLVLLFIPLLTILNKEIKFDVKAEPINFPLSYLVISLPVFLLLDKTLSLFDGVIMIFSVIYLAFTISVKNTLIEKIEDAFVHKTIRIEKELLKLVIGLALIVASCKLIVDTTVLYSNKLSISPFLVGLTLLSIGTNLPELTILFRSTLLKKKTIALGDYVGSAAINTAILGFVTVFNKEPIHIAGGLKFNILLLPIGAVLFLIFTKDKRFKRLEGIILLSLYLIFVLLEFFS